jgi:hypothetical protein
MRGACKSKPVRGNGEEKGERGTKTEDQVLSPFHQSSPFLLKGFELTAETQMLIQKIHSLRRVS